MARLALLPYQRYTGTMQHGAHQDYELLSQIAYEICMATDRFRNGDETEEVLYTSADLARQFNIKLDKMKKKIRLLRKQSLIRPVSVSPKRYEFDRYQLREMSEEDPLYGWLFNEDSPYRIVF